MADVDAPLALAGDFPDASLDDWLALAGDVERCVRRRTTASHRAALHGGRRGHGRRPAGLRPVRTRPHHRRHPWRVGHPPGRRRVAGPRCRRRRVRARGLLGVAATSAVDGETDERSLGELLDGVLLDVAPVVLDAGSRWLAAATGAGPVCGQRAAPTPSASPDRSEPTRSAAGSPNATATTSTPTFTPLATEARLLAAEHPNVRVATIDGTRFHDRRCLRRPRARLRRRRGRRDAARPRRQRHRRRRPRSRGSSCASPPPSTSSPRSPSSAPRGACSHASPTSPAPRTPPAASPLHAVTSRAMATRYDAAVNMLRATVACFAAAVGGADAITVLPHDALQARAERARPATGAQHPVGAGAGVARSSTVIDPAGGSWYVERLTDAARRARRGTCFQERRGSRWFPRRRRGRHRRRAPRRDPRRARRRRRPPPRPDRRRHRVPQRRRAGPSRPRPRRRRARRTAGRRSSRRCGMRVDAAAAGGTRPAVLPRPPRARRRELTADGDGQPANFFEHRRARDAAPIGRRRRCRAGRGAGAARRHGRVRVRRQPTSTPADSERLAVASAAAGATRVYSAAATHAGADARAELADLLDHLGVP